MKGFIISLAIATGIALYMFWPESEVKQPVGILAEDAPIQKNLPSRPKVWKIEGFEYDAQASFRVEARLLSKEFYKFGNESSISPVDYAIGWGELSNQAVVENIDFSQKNRWYFWKTDGYPISNNVIQRSTANIHIIPANDRVRQMLDKIKKGNIFELKGFLVDVKGSDGWRWRTSTTRTDTGGGSCEIVWVEELRLIR
ncbi:MAG: hypothetical protein ABIJ40_07680 [Bacteroidota bacterium]